MRNFLALLVFGLAVSSARGDEKPAALKVHFIGVGEYEPEKSLALLKKELEERIADLGRKGSWPEILADLDSLTETKVEQDDKCFLLRSPPRPAASLALSAAGVALPPTVRQVDQA